MSVSSSSSLSLSSPSSKSLLRLKISYHKTDLENKCTSWPLSVCRSMMLIGVCWCQQFWTVINSCWLLHRQSHDNTHRWILPMIMYVILLCYFWHVYYVHMPKITEIYIEQLYVCQSVRRVHSVHNNRLLLNSTKTEFIWLGSTRRLQTCSSAPLYVSGASILPSQRVRDLGVILDSDLTLTAHVSHIVSVCYFHLRQLRLI